MDLARALEIVGAICDRTFYTMGLSEKLGSLEGVSLAEMCAASILVEAENYKPHESGKDRVIHVIPDDRLIAAVYAAEHYTVDVGTIILIPCTDDETWMWQEPKRKALVMMELSDGKAKK